MLNIWQIAGLCAQALPLTFILSIILGVIALKRDSLQSQGAGKALLIVSGIIVVLSIIIFVIGIFFSSGQGLAALDVFFYWMFLVSPFLLIQLGLLGWLILRIALRIHRTS